MLLYGALFQGKFLTACQTKQFPTDTLIHSLLNSLALCIGETDNGFNDEEELGCLIFFRGKFVAIFHGRHRVDCVGAFNLSTMDIGHSRQDSELLVRSLRLPLTPLLVADVGAMPLKSAIKQCPDHVCKLAHAHYC